MACAGEPAPDVVVELSGACPTFAPRAVEDELLAGAFVRALVGDRPDRELGWAVATDGDADFLQRLPAVDGAPRVDLDTVPGTGMTLVPGPRPDETWLLLAGAGALEVWRLRPDEIVKSGSLAPYPAAPVGAWVHALVFVGQQPYVLAAPRESESLEIDLYLARVDDDLELASPWLFEFSATCASDPQICPLLRYTSIDVLAVAEPNGQAHAHVLMAFQEDASEELGELTTRSLYVTTVSFSDDPTTQEPTAVLRTNYPYLAWTNFSNDYDVRVAPGQIAVDNTGFYILAGLDRLDLDNPEDNLDPLQVVHHHNLNGTRAPVAVNREVRPHLLQVDGSVAVGYFSGTRWRNVPISALTDDNAEHAALDVGAQEDSVIAGGGRGHYLHRLPPSGAQWVALRCDENMDEGEGEGEEIGRALRFEIDTPLAAAPVAEPRELVARGRQR